MRQVQVTVPADRSDDIVSVLQDNCKVSSLFRHTEDNISCIQFYARPNVRARSSRHSFGNWGEGLEIQRVWGYLGLIKRQPCNSPLTHLMDSPPPTMPCR